MVSVEKFHRCGFFNHLTEDQLKAAAMIAEIESHPKGAIVAREDALATKLYLLLEGDVDLIFSGGGEGAIINALVGTIAPGKYGFCTGDREIMEILEGEVSVLLAGSGESSNYILGQTYDVPANSRFKVKLRIPVDYNYSYG